MVLKTNILKLIYLLIIVLMPISAFAEKPYSHVNSKGNTYYLYKKEVPLKNSDKIQTIYFFSKSADNKKGVGLTEVPESKVVAETKTGLLVLKNKK